MSAVCPGCGAVATRGRWGLETVHEDDCPWMHDPDSEPYYDDEDEG